MIKAAIEKIASLATPETYVINGDTYTTASLKRVAPHIERPARVDFSSLDGIVQAISAELGRDEITKPIFINVEGHDVVRVFTTYRDDNLERDMLYAAKPVLPRSFPEWSEHDDAIISLRSQFIQNEGTEYLLSLLSRVSTEEGATSEDNGVSQKVTASTGVMLKQVENIKQRVRLAPFRTFLEVEQPESEFIVRIKNGDKDKGIPLTIGIIEADGGAWKLAARHNIANYFREQLNGFIEDGQVIVTE